MHFVEAGAGDPVLLLHGFPELWLSWRHQLAALAAHGLRAIAPDLRGFGRTGGPSDVDAYNVEALVGDVTGLLDALGIERAVLVGHDWGADLAWKTALMRPGRVRAVVGLGVPHVPRTPAPPLGILRRHLGEGFYIVWFQRPGVADAALARDVRRTLTTREVWDADWAAREDEPPRPPWLTEEELGVYVAEFARTGFTGGLNWYRNIDRNWELLAEYEGHTIDQPALFMTGSRDPVRRLIPADAMAGSVTDLRGAIVVEGAGHWLQQERPGEVSEALLAFIDEL